MNEMLSNSVAVSMFPLDTEHKIRMKDESGVWVPSKIERAWGISSSGLYIVLDFFKRIQPSVPLEAIRDYYGERIALYFGFLSFLSKTMAIPVVFGVVAFIIQLKLER